MSNIKISEVVWFGETSLLDFTFAKKVVAYYLYFMTFLRYLKTQDEHKLKSKNKNFLLKHKNTIYMLKLVLHAYVNFAFYGNFTCLCKINPERQLQLS